MAIGSNANILSDSYVSIGRETTLGTRVTATAGLDFLSMSLKTMQESKTLEQVERRRTMSKSIRLGKKIEGGLEFYFFPENTACGWLMQNAFGGTVTSATTTSQAAETTGGTGFDHVFEIGNMDQANKSLTVSTRVGPSATGKVFEYVGCRVNEFSISAELDDAVKVSTNLIGMDSSSGAADLESNLTITAIAPLSFENGRFSAETTFASLTSTSFWHVQAINFALNNNLKADNESRRIGSDILTNLPVGVANFTLSVTMRFDTTTAYDAMINDTSYACEFEFFGDTISGSVAREGLTMAFPKVKIVDAGVPEIGGPDGILTSEVTFQVLRDDSSATGYAVQATLTNNNSSV